MKIVFFLVFSQTHKIILPEILLNIECDTFLNENLNYDSSFYKGLVSFAKLNFRCLKIKKFIL